MRPNLEEPEQIDGDKAYSPGGARDPDTLQPERRSLIARYWRISVVIGLLGTMFIGVYVRLSMSGLYGLHFDSNNLRHAHSHFGYFGLLFPLAWIGWRQAGAKIPGRAAITSYVIITVITIIGFAQSGYALIGIAGSTAVALYWIWSAWRLLPRMKTLDDPLAVVPIGIVASMACVPPVAMTIRSQPALAQGLVSTFLAGLLFLGYLPSILAGRGVKAGPWPLLLLAGTATALNLGALPHWSTKLGMLVYALLLLYPAMAKQLEAHLRVAWLLVAMGLTFMAVGILPNAKPIGLGATHFLILGALMPTIAPLWLRRTPPQWAWLIGHALWGSMSAALVLQGYTTDMWTTHIATFGGVLTLAWWGVVLVLQVIPGSSSEIAPLPQRSVESQPGGGQ